MNKSIALLICLFCTSISSNASLISRFSGQAAYDTDLNITWLADANLALSNTFGVSGIDSTGGMFGQTANEYINAMNLDNGTGYLGVNTWRHSILPCFGTTTYNCTNSEFGHLFYNELSGTAHNAVSNSGDPDLSLFSNIIDSYISWYWSGSLSTGHVEVFDFSSGANSRVFATLAKNHVWAVADGDVFVSAVPVPAAAWLFGSALLGFFGFSRRKANA